MIEEKMGSKKLMTLSFVVSSFATQPAGLITSLLLIEIGLTFGEFQQGLAEAAGAVLSTFAPGKVLYFNFVMEVQPECDCMPAADTPLVQDRGILASTDLVAVEQATLDLINGAAPLPDSLAADKGLQPGARVLAETLGVDGQEHVDAAATLGLGSQEYELVPVTEG